MKRIIVLAACIISLLGFTFPGSASAAGTYSIGFDSSQIHVETPRSSGITCSGDLQVNGSSELDVVWFCIRNPQNELTTARANVQGGQFDTTLNLSMGAGQYTVWAGDNPRKFDGKIRFLVENKASQDNRYASPSLYVDSENSSIVQLAATIAPDNLSDIEKLRNIHNWVTNHIAYDCVALANNGSSTLTPASQTLSNGKGMCRDYAFLTAALARASGLPARVIYGMATPPNASGGGMHAWNEIQVNGQWVFIDTCWDAGYVKNNEFVASPTTTYLMPYNSGYPSSHRATSTALY
ncbi:MAG: transglutaminase-like domain-containing protein [Syntrophomonas sp.]